MFRNVVLLYTLLMGILGSVVHASGRGNPDPQIVVDYSVYQDGVAVDHRLSPWKMNWKERPMGGTAQGKALWFNLDGKAQPWAGIGFKRSKGTPMVLTDAWLERGFISLLMTGGLDLYGSPNGTLQFQVKLITDGHEYQPIRSRFIDRGRGLDEDPATWQEVLIPLNYWTDLQAGRKVNGLSIQCVRLPEKSFAFNEVGLVLFKERPAWIDDQLDAEVAQPWVRWPAFSALPPELRADQRRLRVQNGRFVGPDGGRQFLLNPYTREDSRLVYWGGGDPSVLPPSYDLYDREVHGWLYDDLPNLESLCRLGFNSLSATMPPEPWWQTVGFGNKKHDPAYLPSYAREVQLPFFVDMVCWPWTLGKPAAHPDQTNLSADAFTQGQHHWVPYRTIGAGRQAWLNIWSLYARRYRDAEVDVAAIELLNEPAYVGFSADHKAEFVTWLEARYGTITVLSSTWGTTFKRFADVTDFDSLDDLKQVSGRFFDYDAYLAEAMSDLVRAGKEQMRAILPQALVGVQPMGGYMQTPQNGLWKHQLIPHETMVLTPTGGGRWTSGGGSSASAATLTQTPIAAAPLENDLLLRLAGSKMIVDNETYLRGQTARDTTVRLWEHVLAGLDGLTVFSWSKRGWAWREGRERLVVEADKYPYSCLIPLARRTEALRGIHDFARDVQRLAPLILPKPWGPEPRIGLLYSWAQARRRVLEPALPDKTAAYYAALKYSHANFQVIPSSEIFADAEALADLDVLVIGGIDTLEQEAFTAVQRFVTRGGRLIIGESTLSKDLYGRPLTLKNLTGTAWADTMAGGEPLALPETLVPSWLPGHLTPLRLKTLHVLVSDLKVLVYGAGRHAVVTKRPYGKGWVYVSGVDCIGYNLAQLLWVMLTDAFPTEVDSLQLAQLRGTQNAQLATNVLLSRRSYQNHHAVLLQNRDHYEKAMVLKIMLPAGNWRVDTELLPEEASLSAAAWPASRLATQGIALTLPSEAPAVVLLQRVD